MNVSTYWTLPPSRQGKIREKIEKAEKELQRIVGYYDEEDLLCLNCYNPSYWGEWIAITKQECIDPEGDLYREACTECDGPLV